MSLTKRISARCNDEEYEIFLQKCKKANLSRADFTRKMILSSVVRESDKEHQKRVIYLLSNISNNINQIARYSNINKGLDRKVLNELLVVSSFCKSVGMEV